MVRTLFLLSLLFVSLTAEAAPLTARVRVEANFTPTAANGLIFSHRGVIEKAGASFKELSPGVFVVSYPIEERENTGDRFASAVLIAADGSSSFGASVPVSLSVASADLSKLPECSSESASVVAQPGQEALIARLIKIRKDRIVLSKKKLETLLDAETAERIMKLERGFGLNQNQALDAEIAPAELTDRLNRVLIAIKNFEANRAKK